MNKNKVFEFAIVATVVVTSAVVLAANGLSTYEAINFLAAVSGILSVVYCAKGNKVGFLYGLANVALYSILSMDAKYYGEVMLNVLFYIPTNILAWFNWKKNEQASGIVKRKSLTLKQDAAIVGGVAVATVAYHFLLVYLGGANTMLDGMSTVLSIVATVLMWRRYAEQWVCWFIVDAVTVVMWALQSNVTMTVMWAAYLVNAVYGYIVWRKAAKLSE